ncbi:LuxR C-terminal-related transcriptional regulator [Nannocystaceae bacterium ST9]
MTDSSMPFSSSEEFYAWAAKVLQDSGRLTGTEARVCEQLMLGRRYVDVAEIAALSEETVRWYAKRILRKLEAESTREFILVIGRTLDEYEG